MAVPYFPAEQGVQAVLPAVGEGVAPWYVPPGHRVQAVPATVDVGQ